MQAIPGNNSSTTASTKAPCPTQAPSSTSTNHTIRSTTGSPLPVPPRTSRHLLARPRASDPCHTPQPRARPSPRRQSLATRAPCSRHRRGHPHPRRQAIRVVRGVRQAHRLRGSGRPGARSRPCCQSGHRRQSARRSRSMSTAASPANRMPPRQPRSSQRHRPRRSRTSLPSTPPRCRTLSPAHSPKAATTRSARCCTANCETLSSRPLTAASCTRTTGRRSAIFFTPIMASEDDINGCYDLFDKDGKGAPLPVSVVGEALRTLGKAPSQAELKELLAGHSSVDRNLFKALASKLDCPSKEDIIEAFSVFDVQGNGYIPLKELQHVLKSLGEGLEDEILQKLAVITEPDSDQQVNYRHFVDIMTKDL
eukprot:m.220747 g.220747  ORF g.220747 m.220747 type:complete len:367 (-) comp10443_c0_seq1:64-1164(-)